MKIVYYTYHVGKHSHRLYVDEDYDSSCYPARIREIITKCEGEKYEGKVSDFGEIVETEFEKKRYFEIPSVIVSERES